MRGIGATRKLFLTRAIVIVSKFVTQDPDIDFIAKSPERLVGLVEYTKAVEKWFAWAKKYRPRTIGYGIAWKEVHAADSMRTRRKASATN